MSWSDGLSQQDIREMIEDSCQAFHNNLISEAELRASLAKLNCNATDIEDYVKAFMPRGSDVED